MNRLKLKKLFVRIICAFIPFKKMRILIRNKSGLNSDELLNSYFQELKAKKQAINNIKDIKYVFLGSSHVAHGFNPEFFSEKSVNIGSTSQDLYTSYFLYENLLKNHTTLNYVLLEYAIFSKGFNLEKTKFDNLCSVYNYLFNINYESQKKFKKFHYKLNIFDKLEMPFKKMNNGYLYPKSNISDAFIEDRAKKHLRENNRSESQIKWIEKLNKGLSNNQKLIIVIFPIRNDFKNEFPEKNILFNEIYKFAELNNIKIIDFYDDKDFIYSDFNDCDHLNETGAIKLTTKLKGLFND